jgi:dihydrofolate synthase / folylpolyglutamate synthase
MNTYQDTLDYLMAALPMYQRIGAAAFKKDLTNTYLLCEEMDNPQKKFRTIHIAGTNGKGSTSHIIAAVLQAAGYKVGLYTSPHYKDFRERIKVNGAYITEEYIVSFVETYKATFEKVEPSFFEMTVALAFDYFANQAVDIAIIETGLGGRLDSTNIITPDISVITNIGYDHQAMLGDTLALIANEKAGIIKTGVPVVIGENNSETLPVFLAKAKRMQSKLYRAFDINIENPAVEMTQVSADFSWQVKVFGQPNQIISYKNLVLGTGGAYQLQNMATALRTFDILNSVGYRILKEEIYDGFANIRTLTQLQGRWQILAQSPLTIADSGHNEHSLRQTMQQLLALPHNQLHIVLGVVNDKELSTMLQLLPKKAIYYFAKADIPRGLAAETLQQHCALHQLRGETYPSIADAYANAQKKATTNDLIFVGGSCFTVAEVIP